jgi:8-oxo-dGTP pyrophosphatase MutT (NUDIX family)
MPGGYCEPGESPAATAIREVKEEVGLEVELTGYLGAWPDVYGPPGSPDADKATLNIYYTARAVGGEEGTGDPTETLEIGWFGPEELPSDLAFPPPHRPGSRGVATRARLTDEASAPPRLARRHCHGLGMRKILGQ